MIRSIWILLFIPFLSYAGEQLTISIAEKPQNANENCENKTARHYGLGKGAVISLSEITKYRNGKPVVLAMAVCLRESATNSTDLEFMANKEYRVTSSSKDMGAAVLACINPKAKNRSTEELPGKVVGIQRSKRLGYNRYIYLAICETNKK